MKSYKKQLRNTIVGLAGIVCMLTIGLQVFIHFNPYIKLVGTWYGNEMLDLLGDSPFDGALELTFYLDHKGCVVTEHGETNFTYDVLNREHMEWDIIILDGGSGYNRGQRFFIEGNKLNIIRDGGVVIFTRR